jgi:RNA polymerase sigma factor (sigma-70 family)
VLAVCRRVLGNEADAEDAFQATFLVLARKAAATRWEASAAGWLYEVARRVASDMRARARRRLAHEARATLAREEAAVAGADWGELQEALDGELGRLPKRYREPLLLCYWQGLTRDAAARRLGLPLRTLDRRLAQGRDRLRARLSRRGLGLPAALLAAGLPQRASAVPATLSAAACRAALAGGAPARVAALAGGALKSLPLSRLRAALLVSLVLAAGGLGWAALPAGPPAAPGVSAPGGAGPAETEPGPDGDGRPLPAGAVRRLGSRRFRVEGRCDFILTASTPWSSRSRRCRPTPPRG